MFEISNYALLGHIDDAQWAAEEYGALGFYVTVAAIMNVMSDEHPDNLALIEGALRKAGLPE
ncbi:MAG: hypothetical protein ACI9UN_000557 [Granulosicoccus sp.]